MSRFLDLEDRDTTTLAPATRRVPASAYTSAERFAREQDVLFRRGALVIQHPVLSR